MVPARVLLEFPALYRLFGRLIAGTARKVYARQYIRAGLGARVLDIGCGPGDILAHLPPVDYLGIDLNPKYIRAAQRRYADKGTFRCDNVARMAIPETGNFDLVMANGLLHHLVDAEALHLLQLSRRALKGTGRLVTLDGCYVPQQPILARALLRLDRGRFIRTPEAYAALAREFFPDVVCHLRHDLLRVPYTHIIMECSTNSLERSQTRCLTSATL